MENGEWRRVMRIRPTLVIGIGEWGGQVAAAFVRRVGERVGPLPVIRAAALVAGQTQVGPGVATISLEPPDAEPGPSQENGAFAGLDAALAAELARIRHLEAVQVTRRAGWEVENSTGSGVLLVASLDDDRVERELAEVIRSLRALATHDLACRVGLSAILLWPRQVPGEETTEPERVPPQPGLAARETIAPDAILLDEGCTVLGQVNADGLLLPTGEEQADMVGNWLALWATTPLQAELDRMPPGDTGPRFDTIGLAAWEFPLVPLRAYLARRWQSEMLDRLLAFPNDDRGTGVEFMERCRQAGTPWPDDANLHFRVAGETWTKPPPDRVNVLRKEVDAAIETEWARLDALAVRMEESLDPAGCEVRLLLGSEMDELLDGPGLGMAQMFLISLEEAALRRSAGLEREAGRSRTRTEELGERAARTGETLDDLTARFPPWRPRTLLGLLLRPWRLLHLWLLYREIGHCAGTYVGYRQSQWLAQVEVHERRWQAALYAGLVQACREEQETVTRLRSRLEAARKRAAPDPTAEQALARQLEAATLHPGLDDHFYRQVAGEGKPSPLGLLALYGPLSRWARDEWEAGTLGMILEEHAHEQFAFLSEVRLDELLARTYSGAELRRRLATLIDGATVWWPCDEPALSAEERAGLCRSVLVGLPDADSSPLVDLLPTRPSPGPPRCFSTGDNHQVFAAQVIQGLPPSRVTHYASRITHRASRCTQTFEEVLP